MRRPPTSTHGRRCSPPDGRAAARRRHQNALPPPPCLSSAEPGRAPSARTGDVGVDGFQKASGLIDDLGDLVEPGRRRGCEQPNGRRRLDDGLAIRFGIRPFGAVSPFPPSSSTRPRPFSVRGIVADTTWRRRRGRLRGPAQRARAPVAIAVLPRRRTARADFSGSLRTFLVSPRAGIQQPEDVLAGSSPAMTPMASLRRGRDGDQDRTHVVAAIDDLAVFVRADEA